MTDKLPNSDYEGRISMLGSSNLEEINGIYNPREFFVDTRNWVVSIHDGQTPGGIQMARADLVNVSQDALINNFKDIPVNNILFNKFEGTFFGNGGNDLARGDNPQLAKATLGAAISLGSSNELICNDASIHTLSSLNGKQVSAPNATFNVVTNVTISGNSTLICRNLNGAGGKIQVDAGSKIIVNGTVSGEEFIQGAGEVILMCYSSPCFTINFTGKYSVLTEQVPLYCPLSTLSSSSKSILQLNGSDVAVTKWINPLVAQMTAYINSGGKTGVKTKTTGQTNNGNQKGDYFIYNPGAATFKLPKIYNGYATGLANYNSLLYNGTMPTNNVSCNQNVLVYAYAAGRGGSACRAYITSPDNTLTREIWWYAHHSGSSSGQSFATFELPYGWKIRFNKNGLQYRDNMQVYGMNMTSSTIYSSMRIY